MKWLYVLVLCGLVLAENPDGKRYCKAAPSYEIFVKASLPSEKSNVKQQDTQLHFNFYIHDYMTSESVHKCFKLYATRPRMRKTGKNTCC